VDMQHLRCFVAVAEELHFGRAAKRLNLSPSPVSRSIRELESEVGHALFERHYHSVRLTEEGMRLLPESLAILKQFDGLMVKLRDEARCAPAVFRFGLTPLTLPAIIDRVTNQLHCALADTKIDITMGLSCESLSSLKRGELDMALVHLPVEDGRFDTISIASYSFSVAMRSDDPFAGRSSITLTDIRDRRVLMAAPTPQPFAMNRLYESVRQAGVKNLNVLPDIDLALMAIHIQRSSAVGVVPSAIHNIANKIFISPDFAFVPLIGHTLDMQIGLCWLVDRHDSSRLVRNVVVAMRNEFAGSAWRNAAYQNA
jgi:DNA-binding transcriptional LysR family regulator